MPGRVQTVVLLLLVFPGAGFAQPCEEHFQALGIDRAELEKVAPGQRRAHVEAAYRKAAFNTHPDVNADKAKATEQFKKVRHAYEVLWSQMPPASAPEAKQPRESPPERKPAVEHWRFTDSDGYGSPRWRRVEEMEKLLEEEFAARIASSRARTLPRGERRSEEVTFVESFFGTLGAANGSLRQKEHDRSFTNVFGVQVGGFEPDHSFFRNERFSLWEFFEANHSFISKYWDDFWKGDPSFEEQMKLRNILAATVPRVGNPYQVLLSRFRNQLFSEIDKMKTASETRLSLFVVRALTLMGDDAGKFDAEILNRLEQLHPPLSESRSKRWSYLAQLKYLFATRSRHPPTWQELMEADPFRTLLQLSKWIDAEHPGDRFSKARERFSKAFWDHVKGIGDGDLLIRVWNDPLLRDRIERGRRHGLGSPEFFSFLDEVVLAANRGPKSLPWKDGL